MEIVARTFLLLLDRRWFHPSYGYRCTQRLHEHLSLCTLVFRRIFRMLVCLRLMKIAEDRARGIYRDRVGGHSRGSKR